MTAIADALGDVRRRIAEAVAAAGRPPSSVKLVAVSKTKPADAVREAYAAGQRAFGENYAQELERKAAELVDCPDIEWHLIGHVQTNKAKVAARLAHVLHTVDNGGLVEALERRVVLLERPPLPVLVEVNVAGEAQKHGVAVAGLAALLDAVDASPSLTLSGLMTVPPAGDDVATRQTFERLAALRDAHGGLARLPELSMGMSHDMVLAIEAGATMVRVGTAIFGAR